MRHTVLLTPDAENDLEEIYNYIADHDSIASAKYVLDRLMETAKTLATFPERGSVIKLGGGGKHSRPPMQEDNRRFARRPAFRRQRPRCQFGTG